LTEKLSDCFDIVTDSSQKVDLVLQSRNKGNGLYLEWFRQVDKTRKANFSFKPLILYIDIDAFVVQQKTYPARKQGAFNQALGKKTQKIVDATAGWGGDALIMCAQGLTVTMLERHPLMLILLEDAMWSLSQTEWAIKHSVKTPEIVAGDSTEWLNSNDLDTDCIYLDPMFPPKRKKSAVANKYMQFLHWLLGPQDDADDLLKAALGSKCPRVAVKRPDYADALMIKNIKPNDCFTSKLLHYDVYLNGSTA